MESDEHEGNRKFVSVLTNINESSPVTADDVGKAREQYGSLFLRELVARQYSTRFGVVSFSENNLNLLMWSHYTTDGSGFVVGYDANELRKLSSRPEGLRHINYMPGLPPVMGYMVMAQPEPNMDIFLSMKSDHWSYEREWRLILELNETIGTGLKDRHDQPINLVRVPNHAVVSVYYTERTPPETVDLVSARLANPNNRYGVTCATKLVLSAERYGYEESADTA